MILVTLNWVFENWVEIIAALLAFVYMYFSVKQNILLWLFGLLTSAFYIYVYYNSKFYADMSLQSYYVVISIYGWIHWSKGSEEKKNVVVVKSSRKMLAGTILVSFLLWFIIYEILKLTNSDVPIGDAFTTAAAIVATWMLAQKILENWLFWIVIDSVSLALYAYKGLWATTVLFVVYTVVAVIGYYNWKQNMTISTQIIVENNHMNKTITK